VVYQEALERIGNNENNDCHQSKIEVRSLVDKLPEK